MKINEIHNENCLDTMAKMPDNFIDLTVTSPPYDGLRTYNGYSFDFENIAKELFRVTKEGGVVVWNVFDEKQNNGYSCTSLKQALFFQSLGFNLHQYIIYEKNSVAFNAKKEGKLYTNIFEFVFILSKSDPKSVNLICDKRNIWAGESSYDGKVKCVAEFSPRTTIWKYTTSQNDKTKHPAVMPEDMCRDLIFTYSNEGDLIYDPFIGSGTTAKMAHIYKRNWIGSEISKDYVDLANKRLGPYLTQTSIFDEL
jgi:DNA modification methylase